MQRARFLTKAKPKNKIYMICKKSRSNERDFFVYGIRAQFKSVENEPDIEKFVNIFFAPS